MKLLTIRKDGGPESHTTGLFLIEIKSLFTIVLLRFSPGSRDAYHSHAFNAISWIFKGRLLEHNIYTKLTGLPPYWVQDYRPSLHPIHTPRSMFHKVTSIGTTYAISFRGPWIDKWQEYIPSTKQFINLTHGRKQVHV